tara:strand:- start:870 stop:1637 length:768 start_codon:yes stop_codon:yes gene_type:complete
MYNLFTVLNSAYMPFGKIWLNSLHRNTDVEMIKKVYILDTGLSAEDLEYLKRFPKVNIVKSDIDIKHTSDALPKNSLWLQHVLRKTKFFRTVIKNDPTPLIMVDSDCMFVSDFLRHIPQGKDVLVCNRSYHQHDNWIASFFVVNNVENGLVFMKLWIDRMKKLMVEKPERGWFESHSLNLCLQELRQYNPYSLKVGDVFTANVACEEPDLFSEQDTSILHFKGTSKKTNFQERITRFDEVVDVKQEIWKYVNDQG